MNKYSTQREMMKTGPMTKKITIGKMVYNVQVVDGRLRDFPGKLNGVEWEKALKWFKKRKAKIENI
jgi:hypothetical protein